MTPEAQATARELVEDPRWTGERFDALPEPDVDDAWFHTDRGIRWVWEADEWLPDLDDDATGGVILGMLDPSPRGGYVGIKVMILDDGVSVGVPGLSGYKRAESLAHAAGLAWLATAR